MPDRASTPSRAACYIRVSSQEQARTGLSLDQQERELAEFCMRRGWDLVETFREEGESGRKWERPALQRLLAPLLTGKRKASPEARPYDVVVVWRLDRIARNARHTYRLLDRLTSAGVQFVSATEAYLDTTSPIGMVLLGIIAVFAELEGERIAERARDVRRDLALAGRWSGAAPFGYRVEEKRLLPHPEQAPLVQEVFRLFVEDRLTTSAIARRLELRYPSGLPMIQAEVRRMLARPTYAGYVLHLGTRYPGQHAPLVEAATWEAAQELLAARQGKRYGRHIYPLSVLLRCAHCEGPMTGHIVTGGAERGRKKHVRYECVNGSLYHTCQGMTIHASRAEAILGQALRAQAAHRPDAWEVETESQPVEQGVAEVFRRELAELPGRRARLIELAERTYTDTEGQVRPYIRPGEWEQAMARLERRETELLAALAPRAPRKASPAREVRRILREVADVLESDLPPERKKDVLSAHLARVVINRERRAVRVVVRV